MITHFGWSLLGASEEFDPMTSVDFPSVILARILYAGFLIMGVVLLINMLIALLSNTYQRVQVSTDCYLCSVNLFGSRDVCVNVSNLNSVVCDSLKAYCQLQTL